MTTLLALALAFAQPEAAASQPITIGTRHAIASKPLGEKRVVNVVLPVGYAKDTAKRYPILYLIDGGIEQDLLHVAGLAQTGPLWGRSADAIVVGIETKDRRRELAGPTRDPELLKKYPTAGSSAAFRAFIRDEVKPMVERAYRGNGQDALIGESLGGLFVVETFMTEPALFDAYAAIDPSLWWDNEALSKMAASKVGPAQGDRPLYIAIAREQAETPAAIDRLVAALARTSGKRCYNVRSDLLHSTIYQQLLPQALQFLLPPADAPPPEFGYEVQCSGP